MNFELWHVNHIKLMSYNNSLLSPQSRKERGEKYENPLASSKFFISFSRVSRLPRKSRCILAPPHSHRQTQQIQSTQ
jgi:hypothetical protein